MSLACSIKVKDAVKKLKADFVFVAADHDHMISRFQKAMKKVLHVTVTYNGDTRVNPDLCTGMIHVAALLFIGDVCEAAAESQSTP